MIEFREIVLSRESDARLLRRFYDDCLVPAFPDPDELDSLDAIEECLQRNQDGDFGANDYHVIVASEGDEAAAGVIFDYLAVPNAGVIEFVVVNPGHRRSGLAAQLLRLTETKAAADAHRGGQQLAWVAAELDDPFRTPAAQSGMDPFARASVWHRWGYRLLDFPYTQPALSSEQSPVDTLLMVAKTLAADFATGVPTAAVVSLLREYLRWAFRIPEPDTDPTFQVMQRYLTAADDTVPLIPLADYLGRGRGRL
jgi:hypothetical protein